MAIGDDVVRNPLGQTFVEDEVFAHKLVAKACRLGLGVLCFYFCAIMLLTIMLSEFTILERDYATYMLA